jgi:hemoglobin
MRAYQRIGGQPKLRAIIDDSVTRVVDDVMSGFISKGKSGARLREMAYRLAAEQSGGPVTYKGRDLAAVHAPLPIMGGHFMRRPRLLLGTLGTHDVTEGVVTRWIEHGDPLKPASLGAGVSSAHCDHVAQSERHTDKEARS